MKKETTPKETVWAVRISLEAKQKLVAIAARKEMTLSNAASRIILYYAQSKMDYDVRDVDWIKSVNQLLTGINITTQKVAGSTERTEYFIKSLLNDDREPAVAPSPESPADNSSRELLEEIHTLLETATEVVGFDGKHMMQLRLSIAEFNELKMRLK